MGDRYVISDENEKIIYMEATNLYGHSRIQPLPYDELEMWHGDPGLWKKKLDEILNTPDDSDFGYFVEVDLRYPDDIKKRKQKNSHLLLKIKLFLYINIMIIWIR